MNLLIYALRCPTTGEIFYIGKSHSGLARPKRHWEPAELRADPTPKGEYIRDLQAVGQAPEILIIETHKCKIKLRNRETALIRQLSRVLPLLNTINNRRKAA